MYVCSLSSMEAHNSQPIRSKFGMEFQIGPEWVAAWSSVDVQYWADDRWILISYGGVLETSLVKFLFLQKEKS
jgi:hypothetical protein